MENRKSGFLTFIFSFWPGAGEMYQGMMRKGSVIMLVFMGLFVISMMIRNGVLTCIMPVVWFYSFFDTMNIKHMTAEQKKEEEDRFMKKVESLAGKDWKKLVRSRHALLGVLLIFFGAFILFENVIMPVFYAYEVYIPWWVFSLAYNIPTLVIAFVIILLGVRLVRGTEKKTEEKDFIEYGDEKDE